MIEELTIRRRLFSLTMGVKIQHLQRSKRTAFH